MTLPNVLITGDGQLITSGPYEPDRRGVEQLRTRSITEAGVQHLLRRADRRGCSEHREVSGVDDDSGGTFVNIWAAGEQFANGAYGSYGEPNAHADRVAGFVDDAYEYVHSSSAELGPERDLEPAFIDVYAEPLSARDVVHYDDSDFIAWELGDEVPLSGVRWCSRLDAKVVAGAFDDVRLPALFADDGMAFIVAARPALVTDDC